MNEQIGKTFLGQYLQQIDQGNQDDQVACLDILSNILLHMEFKGAITTEEVRGKIEMAKVSTPGSEGISYSHMKHISDKMWRS